MNNMWDERYAANESVYGTEPNEFLRKSLQTLVPGRILFPGEGEGRNAIFAAKKGWQVDACDYSSVAQQKALQRAAENNVKINYFVADLENCEIEPNSYDAIVLIYLHLLPELRPRAHAKLVSGLKPGGILLLETFAKEQLKYNSGGPKNINLLYDLTDLAADFRQLEIKMLEQTEIVLNEGDFHQGLASVIRLNGVKPLVVTS